MNGPLSGRSVPAASVLAAISIPFAALLAIRLLDGTAAGALDPTWLARAATALVAGTGAAASLALLATGLRSGEVSRLAAAAAAVAITAAATTAALASDDGRPLLTAGVAIGAALVLVAVVAERPSWTIERPGTRVAASIGFLLVVEACLVALLASGDSLDGWRPILLAGAAGLGAMAALSASSLPRSLAPALLATGAATLAMARPGTLETLIPHAAVAGALLALATESLSAPRTATRAPAAGARDQGLPSFALHLQDGVLAFDGRLRLRDWNAAAMQLLGIGPESEGRRLDQVLGSSLGRLRPPGNEGAAGPVPLERRGRGEERLQAWVLPTDAGVLAVVHDPAGPPLLRAELDRLAHELRGVLEELMHARRTIELQRAELERAATVDPLTGVASRTATLDRLGVEVAQARRYAHPIAIAVIDVDHFGVLNAAHGLDVGDAVLRELALRLRLRIRLADALGRSASDAFLAILPHTDEIGAATFADTLRQRISQRPIATASGPIEITVSVGVAVMRAGEELDLDGLLGRAEEALASARTSGGNRIALDRAHGPDSLDDRRSRGPGRARADADTTQDSGA
jgi:diguanylate cyclase (GGDEF)-like protein